MCWKRLDPQIVGRRCFRCITSRADFLANFAVLPTTHVDSIHSDPLRTVAHVERYRAIWFHLLLCGIVASLFGHLGTCFERDRDAAVLPDRHAVTHGDTRMLSFVTLLGTRFESTWTGPRSSRLISNPPRTGILILHNRTIRWWGCDKSRPPAHVKRAGYTRRLTRSPLARGVRALPVPCPLPLDNNSRLDSRSGATLRNEPSICVDLFTCPVLGFGWKRMVINNYSACYLFINYDG